MICPPPPRSGIAAGLANCGRTTNTIAANRQITAQQLFPGAQGIIDGLRKVGGDTAKYALDNKLVDELATSTEVERR